MADQPKFGRGSNGGILAVELAPSTQSAVNNWNVHTASWLKHYVYLRVERPKFLQGAVGILRYRTASPSPNECLVSALSTC